MLEDIRYKFAEFSLNFLELDNLRLVYEKDTLLLERLYKKLEKRLDCGLRKKLLDFIFDSRLKNLVRREIRKTIRHEKIKTRI